MNRLFGHWGLDQQDQDIANFGMPKKRLNQEKAFDIDLMQVRRMQRIE